MLPSRQRLTGKDINFMLRRGQKIHGKTFVCVVTQQYSNRSFNQYSIQIPIKADKRATMRNLLKRKALTEFGDALQSYKGSNKKFFLFVNKKTLPQRVDVLATNNKTSIVKEWKRLCKKDFTFFIDRLGRTHSQKTGRK